LKNLIWGMTGGGNISLLPDRSIKPFVIGRKNWLFANTSRGAQASAIVYSIIETAKENGLNPYYYLTYLFEKLPNIDTAIETNLDLLFPWSTTSPDICRVPENSTLSK
jgi:transposase